MIAEALVLIPARMKSTRFPGKPLALIDGVSMVERVYQGASSKRWHTCVVTDHPEIESAIKKIRGQVCRVDDDVVSGTERVALAYQRYFSDQNYQVVINLQGDSPLVEEEELAKLVELMGSSTFDIGTLVKRETDGSKKKSPNVVKVAYSEGSRVCHYFSRAEIPCNFQEKESYWYSHIGIYAFRPQQLLLFSSQRPSPLERVEGLEQLRALQMGLKLGAEVCQKSLLSVDVPGDIEAVEEVLRSKHGQRS